MDYDFYMAQAYREALLAFDINEVPIGCVIVLNNEIIGRGYNRRISEKNVLYHAEMIAINEACKFVGDWRLEDAVLFVTVEPCAMCAGAILQARIKEVVFGAKNSKAGCAGSVINVLNNAGFNHQVVVTENIMTEQCGRIMSDFFRQFRGE